MARDTDKLSGFESENTGGLLSGFLADEDVFDRRSLLRLGSWGAASVGAVIIALYANQSSIGQRREQLAAADLARQAQQIQSVAKQSQSEASRLASAIETLNDDRDRLYSRVTTLEQGLDSVTGAITRQATAPPPAAPAASAAAAAPATATTPPATATPAMAAVTEPPAVARNPPPAAPVVAPVATTVAAMVAKSTDKPPVDTTAPVQAPATVSSIAKSSNANGQGQAPLPPPLMAAKSMMAPPDAAASKLIEPEKPAKADKPAAEAKPEQVAAAPPADNTETDASEAPKLAVQRTEFGVDVGGANSVGGLRALWRGLLKSRSNAALTTLHPIMVIRERSNGLGMQLRLVAGPLGDAATAAKICAGLIENERPCETTVFDGQRLSMNVDEPAAVETPAPDKAPVVKPAAVRSSSHRHSSAKRVENVEPAKKPDSPSGFSAFFSRR